MIKSSNCFQTFFKSRKSKKDIEEIVAEWPQQFTFETLFSATNGFDANNKLGEGGFGLVYKGKLDDGREIAVKKCKQTSDQGKEVFMNEVKLLGPLHHRNVVRFLGYCSHRDSEEMLLVYEYVSNGSLDKLLFVSGTGCRAEALDWKRTYDIIVDIAQGLFYLLHVESQSVTIHRDIKLANILIDVNWVAKIGDFGTALHFPRDHTHVNINEDAGTDGYKAPECMMSGSLSPKADTFSFGVVVLELISGQKNWSPQAESLLFKADELYKKGKSLEFMDPKLVSSVDPDQVKLCVQIGVMCTQFNPKLRPTMEQVISMLSKKQGTTLPEEPRTDGHTSSYASSSTAPNLGECMSHLFCFTTIEQVIPILSKKHGTALPEEPRTDGHISSYASSSSTSPNSGPTELSNNGSSGPGIHLENVEGLSKQRRLTRAARIQPEDVEGLPKQRQLTRTARIRPEDVEGLPKQRQLTRTARIRPEDMEGLPKQRQLTRTARIRPEDMEGR